MRALQRANSELRRKFRTKNYWSTLTDGSWPEICGRLLVIVVPLQWLLPNIRISTICRCATTRPSLKTVDMP
jgi:hypothetical protein